MCHFAIWEVGGVSGLPMLVGRNNWVCGYTHTHSHTHTLTLTTARANSHTLHSRVLQTYMCACAHICARAKKNVRQVCRECGNICARMEINQLCHVQTLSPANIYVRVREYMCACENICARTRIYVRVWAYMCACGHIRAYGNKTVVSPANIVTCKHI